jgi:uncharacterized NAD-dependent epimerase/dehydratase family protein
LEGVIQVRKIVEPCVVEQPFADIEVVHTAGEGVQPNDAVHAVGTDCVVGDATKMRNLVAVLVGLGIAEETGEDVELVTGVEETLLQYVDVGVALLR